MALQARELPQTSLTELDQRLRRSLLAFFRRRVANAAEAEDLAQDVFERLLKSFALGPIRNAEALAFTIAVNLLRDRARRRCVHGIEESLRDDDSAEFPCAFTWHLSPERVVMGERALSEVLGALSELDERNRAIFCLYRFEDLKIREIAVIYGISVSAVEKHVSRALVHLMRRTESS